MNLQVFVEILRSESNCHNNPSSSFISSPIDSSIAMLSYHEFVRHLILTETQYKDDLELLIKFFRNPLRQFSIEVMIIVH